LKEESRFQNRKKGKTVTKNKKFDKTRQKKKTAPNQETWTEECRAFWQGKGGERKKIKKKNQKQLKKSPKPAIPKRKEEVNRGNIKRENPLGAHEEKGGRKERARVVRGATNAVRKGENYTPLHVPWP